MPPRLDDESQKEIEESWDKALTPVNRFDRQELLDALIGTQAYQLGVDKLTFRSEKKYSAGTVIMESYFDRLAPDKERFDVMVLDLKDTLIRHESYGRAAIETTNRELFVDCPRLRQQKKKGTATAEELRNLATYEARRAAIESVFPKPKMEGEPEGR
jgi:hypothetical protein